MKKQFTLALLIVPATINCNQATQKQTSLIQHMRNMEQSMHEAFDAMMQRMNTFSHEVEQLFYHDSDTTQPQISLKETDSAAVITVTDIPAKTVDATIDDDSDMLTIKTDDTTLRIARRDSTYITVVQKTAVEKTDKKTGKATYTSVNTYEYGKLLSGHIDIGKADIAYDKKEKIITIEIPFLKQKKKETKKMPVTIH